jgi:hypothetical protein
MIRVVHWTTDRQRQKNMYRVFDTSGFFLVDERTARKKGERARADKKRNKKAMRCRERERGREGERKKTERERKSKDGIGPVTNTQHRTPGCSFARWCEKTIRHDVFLVSLLASDVIHNVFSISDGFVASPDQ